VELTDVLYEVRDSIAIITLNRPQYRNAQSYRLLDDLDAALDVAMADSNVKVVILKGAGDHFSSGHDLGTPESVADRERRGIPPDGLGFYDNFRHYNMDINIKWRNLPKPTIAMVRGFCIYGGWMIAASMDLIFADESALFLAGLVEYFSIPHDVGIRKAKELLFESRFINAAEAKEAGFVSRIYPAADLERETLAYARRVAENSLAVLRLSKLAINKQQDLQGYTSSMEDGFHDYLTLARMRTEAEHRVPGERRLAGVDLAVRGLRGQRPGLIPTTP
jgi:enoyl-CoA hydratase